MHLCVASPSQKLPVLKVKACPLVLHMAFDIEGLPLYPDVQESVLAAWRTATAQPASPLSQAVPSLSVPTGSLHSLAVQ